ncbi:MAG: MoaD/ThiS family protein [Candidatus Helarchaeota archaeon]
MVTVKVQFMGDIQDKVKAKKLTINTNGNATIGDVLQLILDKLDDKGKENFIKYVWNPNQPYKIKDGMAMLLNGLHVKSSNEDLEKILDKDCDLSIFPPLGGG